MRITPPALDVFVRICKALSMNDLLYHMMLFATGCAAGIINALAGGGPILTLGVLSLTGVDPRIANLTSTVALSPGQLMSGFLVRRRLGEIRVGHPVWLVAFGVIGGALGALILLATTAPTFRALVPWLILFATAIYAASGSAALIARTGIISKNSTFSALFAPLTAYGGYFGGGNSFLVLALLRMSGHEPRLSGEIKNVLIAAINLGAVAVFAVSGAVHWFIAISLGVGGVVGSVIGTRMLQRLSVAFVRMTVIVGGLALAVWMFAN